MNQRHGYSILQEWTIPKGDWPVIHSVRADDGPQSVSPREINIGVESRQTFIIKQKLDIQLGGKDCKWNSQNDCSESIEVEYILCPEELGGDPNNLTPDGRCYRIFYGNWPDVPGRYGISIED